jgi:hypothetical protein
LRGDLLRHGDEVPCGFTGIAPDIAFEAKARAQAPALLCLRAGAGAVEAGALIAAGATGW